MSESMWECGENRIMFIVERTKLEWDLFGSITCNRERESCGALTIQYNFGEYFAHRS